MAHRWEVAKLLDEGLPYLEVAKRAHASTTTVTRVAQWLHNGEGGYRLALKRRKR
jgi:TrpR-related protein YerC/YecD